MKVTYPNEVPSGIRYGDEVTYQGTTFIAHSDAELDQFGDWNIRTDKGWKSFSPNERVTISYVEDCDYRDTYA